MSNPFQKLSVPLVQAPMAGGPTSPALAIAVSRAGGLGMLAAGYKTVEEMGREIEVVRSRVNRFGVNLFVPEAAPSDAQDLERYAQALEPLAEELGVPVPKPGEFSDDHYAAKLDHLVALPVPLVSFTFGLPSAHDVARLTSVGTAVVLNATDEDEIRACAVLNPLAIVVQGEEAGGHRATHRQDKAPSELTTGELVKLAVGITDVPVIAAGGIASRDDAQRMMEAGATAVQVGTLFLTVDEAGTKPAHREAILDGNYRETVATRVFSGRVARALANRFTQVMEAHQTMGYPQVHYMTAPLRAASAANPEGLNLWAGTGFSQCEEISAAEVVARFSGL